MEANEALLEIQRIVNHVATGGERKNDLCDICHNPLFIIGTDADAPRPFLDGGLAHSTCIAKMDERLTAAGYISDTEAQKMYLDGRQDGWICAIAHLTASVPSLDARQR